MSKILERHIGCVTVTVEHINDDSPDYSWLGEFSNYKRPRTKNEKLVHLESMTVLDNTGVWRDAKGRIQAEPEERRGSREYQYTFHSNGHERGVYALQDAQRIKDLNDDHWYFIGIAVKVGIQQKGWAYPKEIGRASLWGIESDSDSDYLRSTARELIAEAIDDAREFRAQLCGARA